MTTRIRIALLGLAAAALTLFVVTTALALDDSKPAPDCHGVLVEDGKSDGTAGQTIPIAECTPEEAAGGGAVLGGATRALPVKLATTVTTAKKAKKSKTL